MIRPYWAIIKDSFREAIASRVLWLVLLLITLVLVALAPLSYVQHRTTSIREDDIPSDRWPEMIELLRSAATDSAAKPVERVWNHLPDDAQQAVRSFRPLPRQPALRDVREFQETIGVVRRGLDQVIESPNLYDKEAWRGVRLSAEGRDLVRRMDELDDDERQRLNRVLVESAFPGLMEQSPPTSIRFSYVFFGEFGDAYPVTKQQLAKGMRAALPYLLDKSVLSIGLLIAVLVTAPIIPQTFDPGSLHLLLSKPIYRSGLYLTKFFGGCAFVLVCAAYLFVGLYLVFGARLGIWEPRLLWCIPIYAFVFAVYYSVAALAGLIWRSAIVSILVALVFWATCFFVGLGKGTMEHMLSRTRIEQIVPAGEALVVVDHSNTPRVWDEATREWRTAFLASDWAEVQWLMSNLAEFPPMLGPVYDPRSERIVAVTQSMNGQQMVASGKAADNWKHREGPPAPLSAVEMLVEPEGAPVILTNYNVYRVGENLQAGKKPIKVLGFAVPLGRGPLEVAGPVPAQTWNKPFAFAFEAQSKALFAYTAGVVQRLERNSSGKYAVVNEKKIETNEDQGVRLAAAGPVVVVARRDGSLLVVDSATLDEKKTITLEPDVRPQTAAGSPDGRYVAILNRQKKLWLLDTESLAATLPDIAGQGGISAIAFTPEGRLLVADRNTRVQQYDLATLEVARRFTPRMDLQETAYRYGMLPIYTVFPKPGEFYKTVQHVLRHDTEDSSPREREKPDASPWQPVWSSLAFMTVMLALGCAYMQWQEF